MSTHRSAVKTEVRADGHEYIIPTQFNTPNYGGCGMIIQEYHNGYIIFCGGTGYDGYEFCPECEKKIKEQYPQGYSYYPGDICKHGNYIGGCGPDYMCFRCEMGLE